ncbi:MAG: hypothetical protein V7647_1396 [Acidobacteriota bacterium]
MAVSQLVERRQAERRFFVLVAALFPFLVLAGFARSYYLKGLFGSTHVFSNLVHLHGVLMTAWVGLFMTQVWLISARRIKLHQRLGIAGAALGVVMIPVGLFTAVAAAKYGSPSFPPDIPPRVFMVVPFFDILMFTIFFGGALYYRKRPAEHKRLILLTVMNFLPPAIGRLPIAALTALGPLAFFGIPDLATFAMVGLDRWKNGRVNRMFLYGAILLTLSHPVRLMIAGTAVWMRFATWLTA